MGCGGYSSARNLKMDFNLLNQDDEDIENANIEIGRLRWIVKNFETSRFFDNGCVYCGDFFWKSVNSHT